MFPNKFSASCGVSAVDHGGVLTDVAQTWAIGLRGVSGEMLAAGLHVVNDSGAEWPPTLPQFRAMCKPNKPAYHKPFPKLLDQPRDPVIEEQALSRLRTIVRPFDVGDV